MKYIRIYILCILLLLLVPADALAANSSGSGEWDRYSSAITKKIKKLDKDAPESFPVPILFGKSVSQIVPDFGSPRGGGARTHEGQDIIAPEGAPIISPTEAVVLSLGDGESSGKYVRTANPGGLTFVYMHLDTIAKIKVGDVLTVGSLIGTVGETGNAKGTTPHLHFEVRKKGAEDPYPFLADSLTLKQKSSFLAGILKEAKNKKKMVSFLVEEYSTVLAQAVAEGYTLPKEIEKMLVTKKVIVSVAEQKKQGEKIAQVPQTLTTTLSLGDDGFQVELLQMYLISEANTKELQALASAGPTGYFGPITVKALQSLQKKLKVTESGVWDEKTRVALTNK